MVNCLMIGIGLRELTTQTAGDLGNFKRMGQPRPIEIAVAEIEDLRLSLQALEGSGMDDAGVVDIEIIPGVVLLLSPRTTSLQPNPSHEPPFSTRSASLSLSEPRLRASGARFYQALEMTIFCTRIKRWPHRKLVVRS